MNDGSRHPLAARDGRANLIRAFKASGCAVCKRRYPELDWSDLHVDHIDPRDKPRGNTTLNMGCGEKISSYTHAGGTGAMLSELLTCQVLCADCHREKHRNGGAPIDRQLALFNGDGSWRYTERRTDAGSDH